MAKLRESPPRLCEELAELLEFKGRKRVSRFPRLTKRARANRRDPVDEPIRDIATDPERDLAGFVGIRVNPLSRRKSRA